MVHGSINTPQNQKSRVRCGDSSTNANFSSGSLNPKSLSVDSDVDSSAQVELHTSRIFDFQQYAKIR